MKHEPLIDPIEGSFIAFDPNMPDFAHHLTRLLQSYTYPVLLLLVLLESLGVPLPGEIALAGTLIAGTPASRVGANFSSIPHTGKLKALMCTAAPWSEV